jgi:hypothetical protein
MASTQVRVDAYKTLAFGSITNSFQAVGTSIAHAWRIICLTNTTDADMIFSFDSTSSNLYVPANSFKLFDLCGNAEPNTVGFFISVGTTVYVKYNTPPTKGAVFVEGIYGSGE